MRYRVSKRNKRLFIDDAESGEAIYSPPDFLRHRMKSREGMQRLAEELSAGACYIDAVIKFETNIARPPARGISS